MQDAHCETLILLNQYNSNFQYLILGLKEGKKSSLDVSRLWFPLETLEWGNYFYTLVIALMVLTRSKEGRSPGGTWTSSRLIDRMIASGYQERRFRN